MSNKTAFIGCRVTPQTKKNFEQALGMTSFKSSSEFVEHCINSLMMKNDIIEEKYFRKVQRLEDIIHRMRFFIDEAWIKDQLKNED